MAHASLAPQTPPHARARARAGQPMPLLMLCTQLHTMLRALPPMIMTRALSFLTETKKPRQTSNNGHESNNSTDSKSSRRSHKTAIEHPPSQERTLYLCQLLHCC